jgi:hypothetical protein
VSALIIFVEDNHLSGKELVKSVITQVPVNIEELIPFILIGREKIISVRAEIRAMQKMGIAIELIKQKMVEAQLIAGIVLDAEARAGELLREIPKATGGGDHGNQYTSGTRSSAGTNAKTKEQVIKDMGLKKTQVHSLETLANNREIMEEVKDEATKKDKLPTREAVLKKVKEQKKEQQKAEQKTKSEEIELINPLVTQPKIVTEGQFWKLGNHTLYCGDTSNEEFTSSVPMGAFAFADPPYNAGVDEWDRDFIWNHDWLIEKAKVVAVTPGIVSIFDFAKRTEMPYIWSVACWINNGMTRGAMGFGNWIYTALFSHDSIQCNSQDFLQLSIKTSETDETNHRGRKPAELIIWLINRFTKAEDIIIDPFLGSGTTLLAAETLGRSCFGGEINPQYCSEIIARWEKQTKREAEVYY